jgi:hypothetical protein
VRALARCGPFTTKQAPVSSTVQGGGKRRIVLSAYSHFAAHCSVTAKAQDKFTRHQNVERYRRLLKTATDEERRNYLGRLIVEELQKQKDAGDSDYQY